MRLSAAFLFMTTHSHLAHWKRPTAACFLTWRLAGSLSVQRIADVWTTEGAKFLAFDRVLDARATGPQWLILPDVARAVADSSIVGEQKGFYELGSWVIMPNHVHLIIYPLVDLSRVVWGIKVASAKEVNRLLRRAGTFWSRDYFDRWIRDSAEEQRIVRYIENNPVKAGLCIEAGAWPFSSAKRLIAACRGSTYRLWRRRGARCLAWHFPNSPR
jgi:REP element-mobilizing transposase RayT